jgi:hypothetical protein
VVVVDDEGSGISATGMGLHAAKRSMEKKMGGAIQASNLPTGGARFELRFLPATKVPLFGGDSDPKNGV